MIYVDDFYLTGITYRGMKMCHMVADSTEELLQMADKIGVQRKWIQKPGTKQEHFDICFSKRELAIRHGAIPIEMRVLAKATVNRDSNNSPLLNTHTDGK